MKKLGMVILGVACLGLGGCISMNISGAGNLGDVDLGANVDPINGTVGADAGKTITNGNTSTRIGGSTSGKNLDLNTDVQHHSGE